MYWIKKKEGVTDATESSKFWKVLHRDLHEFLQFLQGEKGVHTEGCLQRPTKQDLLLRQVMQTTCS